jgi:glycosyltransferase involved in cell wall biosynthesis
MRICIVYDCLFEHTVGGAERWYRNLALRLSQEGHEVTYATMRQWDRDELPELDGVRVVAVAPRMDMYVNGRRRILPAIVFGLGVLRHLAGRRTRYDVVHTASFPYFSLLAIGALRRRKGYSIVVDWHEVWRLAYWREYLGLLGAIGYLVQCACVRVRQDAFCFSKLHAKRLRGAGLRGALTVIRGQYDGELYAGDPAPAHPVVVFAGRHIPEKGVTAIVPALLHARRHAPELRCAIYGDGPDRAGLLQQIESLGASAVADAPGFVDEEIVEHALRHALCLILPSCREGYGLVVVEALALGTPVVVVAGPDNAAVEFIEDGVNGFVSPSSAPDQLGETLLRVHRAGPALRESAAAWFNENAHELSLERSLDIVAVNYPGAADRLPAAPALAPTRS